MYAILLQRRINDLQAVASLTDGEFSAPVRAILRSAQPNQRIKRENSKWGIFPTDSGLFPTTNNRSSKGRVLSSSVFVVVRSSACRRRPCGPGYQISTSLQSHKHTKTTLDTLYPHAKMVKRARRRRPGRLALPATRAHCRAPGHRIHRQYGGGIELVSTGVRADRSCAVGPRSWP